MQFLFEFSPPLVDGNQGVITACRRSAAHLGAALYLGDALFLLADHVVTRRQLRAQRVDVLLQPADGLRAPIPPAPGYCGLCGVSAQGSALLRASKTSAEAANLKMT